MGVPPGVPVTAAKVHRTLPLVLSRGLSRHTTASTPSGACPGVPAAWLRAAALRSYGKYSLSETDVLRRRMTQMGQEDQFPSPSLSGRCRWVKRPRWDGKEDDAPKPDLHATAFKLPRPTPWGDIRPRTGKLIIVTAARLPGGRI